MFTSKDPEVILCPGDKVAWYSKKLKKIQVGIVIKLTSSLKYRIERDGKGKKVVPEDVVERVKVLLENTSAYPVSVAPHTLTKLV